MVYTENITFETQRTIYSYCSHTLQLSIIRKGTEKQKFTLWPLLSHEKSTDFFM